jgi:hypothetical protein
MSATKGGTKHFFFFCQKLQAPLYVSPTWIKKIAKTHNTFTKKFNLQKSGHFFLNVLAIFEIISGKMWHRTLVFGQKLQKFFIRNSNLGPKNCEVKH